MIKVLGFCFQSRARKPRIQLGCCTPAGYAGENEASMQQLPGVRQQRFGHYSSMSFKLLQEERGLPSPLGILWAGLDCVGEANLDRELTRCGSVKAWHLKCIAHVAVELWSPRQSLQCLVGNGILPSHCLFSFPNVPQKHGALKKRTARVSLHEPLSTLLVKSHSG